MSVFIQNVINGLVSGSYYAVLGVGLTLIWGVLKMINVAHGDFYMLGAYGLYTFFAVLGIPVFLSCILAVACVFIVAMALEKVVLSPAMKRTNWGHAPFVLTLGISIFLQNLALLIWGERYKSVPYFNDGIVRFLDATLAIQRVIVVSVALFAIVVLMFFIKRTKFGWAISATAQDIFAANLMGINTKNIYMYTFALSAAMTAISGCLLAPIFGINPWMGATIQLKSFVVCVLGGLGSIGGSIFAGLCLGLIESFAVQYIGTAWQNVLAYGLLIVMFWFRPTGLLGKKEW